MGAIIVIGNISLDYELPAYALASLRQISTVELLAQNIAHNRVMVLHKTEDDSRRGSTVSGAEIYVIQKKIRHLVRILATFCGATWALGLVVFSISAWSQTDVSRRPGDQPPYPKLALSSFAGASTFLTGTLGYWGSLHLKHTMVCITLSEDTMELVKNETDEQASIFKVQKSFFLSPLNLRRHDGQLSSALAPCLSAADPPAPKTGSHQRGGGARGPTPATRCPAAAAGTGAGSATAAQRTTRGSPIPASSTKWDAPRSCLHKKYIVHVGGGVLACGVQAARLLRHPLLRRQDHVAAVPSRGDPGAASTVAPLRMMVPPQL
ncbi:uncharacterized protein CEXT_185161 [Caerostris extrusa]|uniref:Uncharacterized protein n=1 Tax=Caerostris extrusa TaxID=172846 RepID=A0AAV4SSJ1_CAEEX|nr:uncharacterized protein CEXT_185161 [Caerostris extrusa]